MSDAATWRKVLGLPGDGLDMSDLGQALVAFAGRLAPHEFRERPLYVGFTSMLPATFDEFGKFARGYTHPLIDLWLKPHVEWRGRGAGMVIHDMFIAGRYPADVFGGPLAGFRFDAILEEVCCCWLHELAHCVEHVLEGITDCQIPETIKAAAFDVQVDRVAAMTTKPPTNTEQHGESFTRVALHLLHRARAAGADVSPRDCTIGGSSYGMGSGETYLDALSGECAEMAGESFTGIMATPAPHRYQRRWQRDQELKHTCKSRKESK